MKKTHETIFYRDSLKLEQEILQILKRQGTTYIQDILRKTGRSHVPIRLALISLEAHNVVTVQQIGQTKMVSLVQKSKAGVR